MTQPPEPPDSTPPNSTPNSNADPPDRIPGERTPFGPDRTPQHAEAIPVPENFRGYAFTYVSNLGRPALAGANTEDRAVIERTLFDGFVRRNEYNSRGDQTFGPAERRAARNEYERKIDEVYAKLPRERRDRIDLEFDWVKWREEYDAATAAA